MSLVLNNRALKIFYMILNTEKVLKIVGNDTDKVLQNFLNDIQVLVQFR